MSSASARPTLHVPARKLPIPTSISPQAQAQMAIKRPPMPPYPALDDIAGWRHYAATEAALNREIRCFIRSRLAAAGWAKEGLEEGEARSVCLWIGSARSI